MAFDLTGIWICDDGAVYYLRQSGNQLWWAGLSSDYGFQSGLTFTNIFQGTIRGQTIQGNWADVPRGTTVGYGTLTLTVQLGPDGDPANLVKVSETGGFSGANWDSEFEVNPVNLITATAPTAQLFSMVKKNIWYMDWGDAEIEHESLGQNLDVIRDQPVVLFGTLQASSGNLSLPLDTNFPSNRPHTIDVFWDLNHEVDEWLTQSDGDVNADIAVKVNDLPADFFNGVSATDASDVRSKFTGPAGNQSVAIHTEQIMFGPKGDTGTYIPLLPGWGDMNGNSVLINGRPVNGNVFINNDGGIGYLGGIYAKAGQTLRVSGVLSFDHGHGEQGAGRGLEIHPVFAIDFIDFTSEIGRDPNNLSGAWATSDGGTCYVREIYNQIWFLWMRAYRDRQYATVFVGTRNGSTITGNWIDIPLGDRVLPGGSLTLTVDNTQLNMSADAASAFSAITWRKLYDASGVMCPVAKVKITGNPGINCQNIILAGAPMTFLAALQPHTTIAPPNFVWNVIGAVGSQTSPNSYLIPNTPAAGNKITIAVTGTDANGCKYQAEQTFTTGTQVEVDGASELCAIAGKLQKYIDSIYPSLPYIPIGPGDPFVLPSIAQLQYIQQSLTQIIQLAQQLP